MAPNAVVKPSQPGAGNLADRSWRSLVNGFLPDLFPLGVVGWPHQCVSPPDTEQQCHAGVPAPVRCIQGLHPASQGDGDSVPREVSLEEDGVSQGEGTALWTFAAVTRSKSHHGLWWKAAASSGLITAAALEDVRLRLFLCLGEGSSRLLARAGAVRANVVIQLLSVLVCHWQRWGRPKQPRPRRGFV